MLVVSWYAKDLPGEPGAAAGSPSSTWRPAATGTCCWSCPGGRRRAGPRAAAGARRRHRLVRALPAHRRHRARRHHLPASTTCCGCRTTARTTCPARARGRPGLVVRLPLRAAGPVRLPRRDRRGAGAAALLVPVAGPQRRRRRSWWSASTAAARQTRRLARFPLDPETLFLAEGEDGVSRPLVARRRRRRAHPGRRGRARPLVPHPLHRPVGARLGLRRPPGAFRRYRWATPMGPEDIAWWPSTDLLWSVTEHPRRRWVFAMRRSWFDRLSPLATGVNAAAGAPAPAGGSARPAGRRSPRSRSPPRTCPPARLRVSWRTLSQPGAGLGAHVHGQLEGRRPAGHPEVEGHRRQHVADRQQRERVGLAAVGEPEPARDHAGHPLGSPTPSRRGRGRAGGRTGPASGRTRARLGRRRSCGTHSLGRRQRGLDGRRAHVGAALGEPRQVAAGRERADPAWCRPGPARPRRSRPSRPRGVRRRETVAGPGVDAET